MARRQLIVKDNHIDIVMSDFLDNFLQFARTDKSLGVNPFDMLPGVPADFDAGCFGQQS